MQKGPGLTLTIFKISTQAEDTLQLSSCLNFSTSGSSLNFILRQLKRVVRSLKFEGSTTGGRDFLSLFQQLFAHSSDKQMAAHRQIWIHITVKPSMATWKQCSKKLYLKQLTSKVQKKDQSTEASFFFWKQDNTKQCVYCWHRCLVRVKRYEWWVSLDFTNLQPVSCTGSLQDNNNNSYCKWQQKWLMEFILLDLLKNNNLSLFSLSLCHNCLSRTEMKASMLTICPLLCCPFLTPTPPPHPTLKLKKNTPNPF